MAKEEIADPVAFFDQLGGLHDTCIDGIEFDPRSRALEFAIDDLHANFESLPDDPGRRPCTMHFEDVSKFGVDVDVSTDLAIRIDGIGVERDGAEHRMTISINLGCGPRTDDQRGIVVVFEKMHIQDN